MGSTIITGPGSDTDLLQRWCADLVAAELERLARRVPALRSGQLRDVEAALGNVLDDLVLSRSRSVCADQLAVLFDLAET